MKRCTRCKVWKPLSDFGKDNKRKDKKSVYCKECSRILQVDIRKRNNAQRTEYNRQYRNKNRKQYNEWERNYYYEHRQKLKNRSKEWRDGKGSFTMMHLAAKLRARKKNFEYELSPEIIEKLCLNQNNKCALSGIEFDYSPTDEYRVRPFAPSIDRIDSKKGYTLDNVQMTCVIVNKAKNEFSQLTFDRMCLARARTINGT